MTARKSLLATAVFAVIGGGVAYAAQPNDGPLYDPAQLPTFKGKVTQYDLTPRGDVDGLILDGNTEVHFSPRQSTLLVATVKPGDSVTVHGLKARALPLIKAVSITQDASGQSVVESHDGPGFGPHGPGPEGHRFWHGWFGHGHGEGPSPHGPEGGPEGGPGGGPGGHGPEGAPPPPPPEERGPQLTASGTIKLQLHDPRGGLNGVLLDDGTEVHFPPPVADQLGDAIAVGKTIAVKGPGSKTVLGTAIAAHAVGPNAGALKDIAPPPPPPGAPEGGPGFAHHHGGQKQP